MALGAEFVDFLAARSQGMLALAPGIVTPRRFGDPRREHLATRRASGLFDFSFMGCVEIAGSASLDFLHTLQTRALHGLRPGRIAYTLLLRDDGSVLNDATVWRIGEDRYWLFVGRRSDVDLVERYAAEFEVAVTDLSRRHAVIAVQGAGSWRVIERSFRGQHLSPLPYYGFETLEFAGAQCQLARIGYSGETGYELVIRDAAGAGLWLALLAAGAGDGLVECGFDAVDSLRIEAGHLLFARELASTVSPFELGLQRLVDFYQAPFRGSHAIRARRWQAPSRRLVGLLLAREAATQPDLPDRLPPGRAALTSACWSPILGRWLGLGYANNVDRHPGTRLMLSCGTPVQVSRLPFYDPAKHLPRNTR